ncbi:MAG: four helix bundle protein, partial [Anaerolineaceae bacterium]|nr:four helix bundle protein [Anaerolineaceae bacterium]
HLLSEKKEYVLSKQLLRSGTSVGANVKEAICGFTRADFRAKMSIWIDWILTERTDWPSALNQIQSPIGKGF